MRKLVAFFIFAISLFGAQNGDLSFYILKDSKPLANQEVALFIKEDKKLIHYKNIVSDKDGYAHATLKEGEYQLHVLAKEAKTPLIFARKNFIIKATKESQVIVLLDSKNHLLFTDIEAPSAIKATKKDEDKKVENGFLQMTLISSEDKKPIKGARVFVKGENIDVLSDEKGTIEIEIPVGEQTLSIIHTAFSSQSTVINIAAKETTAKIIELSPASMELDEFVVLAPQIEGSVAAVMAEEKNSNSIANIIGSEQISKQGDNNAAGALKRVAGVTLIGGKYVYVRGLGDRYSSTELNGMALPSPDPVRRTVPLDMFPAGVIGSLQVLKSFSPDVSGAFGGGYVNVRSKKKSDEDYVKISFGIRGHSSSGDKATSYKGSKSDWSGYDSSYRAFSSELLSAMAPSIGEASPSLKNFTNSDLQKLTTHREYNRKNISIPYGSNMDIELSKSFTIDGEHEINIFGSYGYRTESMLRKYTSYDYIISAKGNQIEKPDNIATNNLFRTTIRHGGMLNLSYKYKNFDMGYTKLFVLNTLDQTRDISGTFGENNSDEQQNYLEWQERQIDLNQLNIGADYDLYFKNRFDLGVEFAKASEYVPNDIIYDYRKLSTSSDYTFVRNQSNLEFLNRTTNDDVFNMNLKNRTSFELFSDEDYLEIGAALESKDRIGRVNRLRIQSRLTDPDIISSGIDNILNYPDASALRYSLTAQPKDNYNASLNKNAIYLKSMLKPTEKLDIVFGARKEHVTQKVEQFAVDNNMVTTTQNELKFNKTLPSFSAKYELNKKNQLKFAYGKTFVYPDFREFINSEFIHPEFVAKVAGNPDLIETDIDSYDLQYGYYFNEIDNITASIFYKDLKNPIEDVTAFTTSTLDRFSFENSNSAKLNGVEISWYKNFAFIHSSLEDFIFSGNYTLIDSKVTLTDEQKQKFVTQNRQLQGLSPEVINLSLTYQNRDRSLNLSYNKMSERLMRVALKNGDVILGLDDHETPPDLLDFTWIEKFKSDSLKSDLTLTLKIRNILDSETIWKQGNLTTLKFKTGQSFSMTLGAKF